MLTFATLALALVAQGPDYSWSGTMAAGKQLTVKNISGDIRVESASGRTVEISATKRAGKRGDPEDVTIRRIDTSEGIEVCVIYPGMRDDDDCDWRGNDRNDRGRNDNRNDTRVDFVIRLPASVDLEASTVSGDVFATGVRGGEVDASTVSGNVDLRNVTAETVDAQTVSGNVALSGITSSNVSAQTVSGSVTYSGQIAADGDYEFETLSGDVILSVPANTGADVRSSTFSGSFSTNLPFSREGSEIDSRRRRSRRNVRGTLGSGGASLQLTSFSGDVVIKELGRAN